MKRNFKKTTHNTASQLLTGKFWTKRLVGSIKALHPQTKSEIYVKPQRDAMITSDLDMELRRLPGLLSWYLALRSTAKTALKNAMHNEHNVSEDLYAEKRAEKGAKKTTETELKMAVKTDPRMRVAYRHRMEAEEMVRNMEDAVEQITTKKWTLRDLVELMKVERGTRDNL